MRITYLGGPSAIIEWHTARLLTDPTFDPAGEEYVLPAYTLRKTQGPALTPEATGHIDAVPSATIIISTISIERAARSSPGRRS